MATDVVTQLRTWSQQTGITLIEPTKSGEPYSFKWTANAKNFFIDVLPDVQGNIVVQHGVFCEGHRLNNGVLPLPFSADLPSRLTQLESEIEGDEELSMPVTRSSRDWYQKATPLIASASNFKFR